MKAKLHGIELEGTPEEIAQVVKLVGQQPAPPMVAPVYPNPHAQQPFGPWPVTCDIGKPGSGQVFRREDATIQVWN